MLHLKLTSSTYRLDLGWNVDGFLADCGRTVNFYCWTRGERVDRTVLALGPALLSPVSRTSGLATIWRNLSFLGGLHTTMQGLAPRDLARRRHSICRGLRHSFTATQREKICRQIRMTQKFFAKILSLSSAQDRFRVLRPLVRIIAVQVLTHQRTPSLLVARLILIFILTLHLKYLNLTGNARTR